MRCRSGRVRPRRPATPACPPPPRPVQRHAACTWPRAATRPPFGRRGPGAALRAAADRGLARRRSGPDARAGEVRQRCHINAADTMCVARTALYTARAEDSNRSRDCGPHPVVTLHFKHAGLHYHTSRGRVAYLGEADTYSRRFRNPPQYGTQPRQEWAQTCREQRKGRQHATKNVSLAPRYPTADSSRPVLTRNDLQRDEARVRSSYTEMA